MATPFDAMLYAHPISRIHVTAESVNEVTGANVPESTSTTAITGVLHDTLPVKPMGVNETQTPKAIIVEGYQSIHTGTRLALGDRVQITERDGSKTLWEVATMLSDYPLLSKTLGITWYSFSLKIINPSVQDRAPIVVADIVESATFDPITNHWTIVNGKVAFVEGSSTAYHEPDISTPAIDDWN